MPRLDDTNPLYVKREIPLWSIVLAVVSILVSTITLGYGVIKSINDLDSSFVSMRGELIRLTGEVKELTTEINGKNLKDVEHDMRINNNERRLLTLEGQLKYSNSEQRTQPK